jgi:flavin reductase (DIM6/NTAB) family NADH-FMN oxidoreductase RutF
VGIEWLPTGASLEREPVNAPPILADSLGYLRCAVEYDTAAGDSTLVVARIVDACVLRGGEPLTMRETGFRHSG